WPLSRLRRHCPCVQRLRSSDESVRLLARHTIVFGRLGGRCARRGLPERAKATLGEVTARLTGVLNERLGLGANVCRVACCVAAKFVDIYCALHILSLQRRSSRAIECQTARKKPHKQAPQTRTRNDAQEP